LPWLSLYFKKLNTHGFPVAKLLKNSRRWQRYAGDRVSLGLGEILHPQA
jgi:hypothetical protein